MPYLDESGFSAYDSNLKEWVSSQNTKTIPSSIYPWTKTVKAGAVSCYPVGGTELKPVVDFLFTETPPSSGNKGPDNPSTITGVSSMKMTRCGKNLCPSTIVLKNQNQVTATTNADGSITFNGTVGSVALLAYIFANNTYGKDWPEYLKHSTTYAFSMYGDTQDISFAVYRAYGSSYGSSTLRIHAGETGTLLLPDESSLGMLLRFEVAAGTVLNNATVKVQIEESSAVTDFEPYAGADYTLPLGNTYYGGTLDTASGVMTVTHGLLFLNSSQNWSYTTQEKEGLYRYQYRFAFPKDGGSDGRGDICSHFTYSVATGENAIASWHHSKGYLYIKTSLSTVDDLKTWFTSQTNNNTPVCVAYELASPYTVQLSPTQILSLAQADKYTPRLNTVYTDASAVRVGYVKSPMREEFELQQAIVAQGGNI